MLTLNTIGVCDRIEYNELQEEENHEELCFSPLTIDDKWIFDRYLNEYNFNTCEYSFANLLIWRKGCDITYTIYNGVLIIKKKDFKGNYHFMQPMGYNNENLKKVIEILKEYRLKNKMKYLFKDVEKSFLKELKDIYGDDIEVEDDIDNFDYIYDSSKLATLSGKKLHSKKNHYNYFTKTYDYSVKDLSEESVREDCIRAAEIWHEEKYNGDEYLSYELKGIKELIKNMDVLNLKGIAIYVDDVISAFTIGESVNKDMAIIHIEKGRSDIRGIYSFINKTFVEKYFTDVKFINREQDLGIEGLRKAKKSYYPIRLEEKYCVNLSDDYLL
ncbi:DUF2156 domain-containing protein [Clostridium sp. CX1]|uniref:DUF2156 domain-containing protein n=1 Tax=Clostridium sp. CX1 TaxID=2978346 RepID=UPI0021BEA3B4|nr:DUF2156 domain-containing protein [Clostridium sp. CX1]MCT8975380.1 DUF2156 domain-containing protein [Clostridium sp. CX1]